MPEADRDRRRRRRTTPSSARSDRDRRTASPSRSRKRAAAGTGGAFGMSGTRRAALFAMVLCALALTIAVPLRTYLAQRDELRGVGSQQDQLKTEVALLEERKRQLDDPAMVEAEARRRLHYVKPGETPYIVQLPGDEGRRWEEERPEKAPAADTPWYQELWDSVVTR